jgi:hypothetical protein
MFAKLIAPIKDYCDNPDPLAAVASVTAFVVAANQPFYPLYLHAIAGVAATPAWLTLLSTPAFAAVPFVARRHSLAGRALLPLAGIANTMLGAKLMGAGAGAELFLLPCVLLAAVLFRSAERAAAFALLALAALAYFGLRDSLGAPLCAFTAQEAGAVARLNAASVAGLLVFVGFQLSGLAPNAASTAPR